MIFITLPWYCFLSLPDWVQIPWLVQSNPLLLRFLWRAFPREQVLGEQGTRTLRLFQDRKSSMDNCRCKLDWQMEGRGGQGIEDSVHWPGSCNPSMKKRRLDNLGVGCRLVLYLYKWLHDVHTATKEVGSSFSGMKNTDWCYDILPEVRALIPSTVLAELPADIPAEVLTEVLLLLCLSPDYNRSIQRKASREDRVDTAYRFHRNLALFQCEEGACPD